MEEAVYTLRNGEVVLESDACRENSMMLTELVKTFNSSEELPSISIDMSKKEFESSLDFVVNEFKPRQRKTSISAYAKDLKGGNWFSKIGWGPNNRDVIKVFRGTEEIFTLLSKFNSSGQSLEMDWEVCKMLATEKEIVELVYVLSVLGLVRINKEE